MLALAGKYLSKVGAQEVREMSAQEKERGGRGGERTNTPAAQLQPGSGRLRAVRTQNRGAELLTCLCKQPRAVRAPTERPEPPRGGLASPRSSPTVLRHCRAKSPRAAASPSCSHTSLAARQGSSCQNHLKPGFAPTQRSAHRSSVAKRHKKFTQRASARERLLRHSTGVPEQHTAR